MSLADCARVLRECADELSIPIQMLCELSVSSGTFPTMWKQANVIPVHKKLQEAASQLSTCIVAAHLFEDTGESRA